MAVATTGAIFKGFEFDGQSSKDYGIYITGAAVYNAPGRDVEMVSIPGRNGSFALDKGRFENIEVTYPAGVFAYNEADFAQAVADLRNYLCSRHGYCRLVDEYNPTEYRLAIYKSGLEVDPFRLEAGEFNITFDCKPQRYLMSGESAIGVSSGDTILNPTLFEARPMLEVEGYGSININDDTITLENAVMGNIVIDSSHLKTDTSTALTCTATYYFDNSNINSGDTVTIKSANGSVRFTVRDGYTNLISGVSSTTSATGTTSSDGKLKTIDLGSVSFTYGTSGTKTGQVVFGQRYTTEHPVQATQTLDFTVAYTTPNKLKYTITVTSVACFADAVVKKISPKEVSADSTKSMLGHPTYIDLDIGEAYLINNGEPVSLNNGVQMPANLPTLKPGANEITYDNTVTDLKLLPRWWKV